jgi:hypothetical protein
MNQKIAVVVYAHRHGVDPLVVRLPEGVDALPSLSNDLVAWLAGTDVDLGSGESAHWRGPFDLRGVPVLPETWAPEDQWAEHPRFVRSDWEYGVAHGDTSLGYVEWVNNELDMASVEEVSFRVNDRNAAEVADALGEYLEARLGDGWSSRLRQAIRFVEGNED